MTGKDPKVEVAQEGGWAAFDAKTDADIRQDIKEDPDAGPAFTAAGMARLTRENKARIVRPHKTKPYPAPKDSLGYYERKRLIDKYSAPSMQVIRLVQQERKQAWRKHRNTMYLRRKPWLAALIGSIGLLGVLFGRGGKGSK